MNIGYVKIEKKKSSENIVCNIFYKLIYKIHQICNTVRKDRIYENVFWTNNFSKKSKQKLYRLLMRKNIIYAVVEENKDIGYPQIDSKIILKYLLPEAIEYCASKAKMENNEVYLLVDKYNSLYVDIIKDLAEKEKVLNIVTDNPSYKNVEKELEERDIYITVSSNRRKALKRAEIVVNLDVMDINDYTINNNMIIIDARKEGLTLPKFFNGILIKSLDIDTKKIIPTREDLENFNKQKIIEARILQMENYETIRNWVKQSKIYIKNCKNRRTISIKEFKRIKKVSQTY